MAQLVERLASMHRPWVLSPALHTLGLVVYTCDASSLEGAEV